MWNRAQLLHHKFSDNNIIKTIENVYWQNVIGKSLIKWSSRSTNF